MGNQPVLGISFDFIGYRDVLETIQKWRCAGRKEYIILSPPYSVMMSARDPGLAAANNKAGLVLPDGVGITLAARVLGYHNNGRVSGRIR